MAKRTLKGIRADLGLTQKEFAKKLGISESAYQKYEAYLHMLPSDILFKISEVSRVDVKNIKIK